MGPGGGLFYWGPRRIRRGSLWRRASFSIGTQLGDLEGDPVSRDFERWMKVGSGH